MELEELKNIWVSVDERLKKQEILKERIIKEMNYKKTNKSLNVLQWSEFAGILFMLAIVSFIVWAYGKFGGRLAMWDAAVIFSFITGILYFPFLLYKAYLLIKIDLSGNLKNNLFYINKFAVFIKRERLAAQIWIPIYIIALILMIIEAKVSVFIWVFFICLLIFSALFSYWSYKKIYDKNIQSIKKGLDELKELEEE